MTGTNFTISHCTEGFRNVHPLQIPRGLESEHDFHKFENDFEMQYAAILNYLKEYGVMTPNRTGISCITAQHFTITVDDVVTGFPVIRGKKMFPYMALKEILWMLKGRTDVEWLRERGVTYWDEWAKEDGTIGPSYGRQFRNFGGEDQLANTVKGIALNPYGRRHIINLWNAADLPDMALPPCVMNYHFSCIPKNPEKGDKCRDFWLDLHVTQRSADMFLGVPYDLIYAGFFMHIMAGMASFYSYANDDGGDRPCNSFTPRTLYLTVEDTQIYENHVDQVNTYLYNVESNRHGIIESFTSCTCRHLAWQYPGSNKTVDLVISNWLDQIDEDLKTHDIIRLHGPYNLTRVDDEGTSFVGKNEFSYNRIEAQVAV